MDLPSLTLSILLAAVPTLYFLSAITAQLSPTKAAISQYRFALAALLAGFSAILTRISFPDAQGLAWFSSAPVSFVMLGLILFIGLVIARYSQHYLAGEQDEWRYYRSLHFTLTAVSVAVISNHLLVLLAAWVTISLSLHQLLLFYPERPRAVLAAHKKFLFARLAEMSLLGAAVLLYFAHGTWWIDEIISAYPVTQLSLYEQLAAVLLAITALIKCAQLPLHGWLIQVVEAPTPVSALLHAGIINLGGFLLILFAPLLVQVAVAQALLLIVAGLSTLLAGLIMMTRVSVKVRLAWSTVAQMGFMLVECALGLFDLALLHLIAHSCYKAYAFLNAGSAVQVHLYRQLSPAGRFSGISISTAVLISAALLSVPIVLWTPSGPFSPWLLLMFSLALLISERVGALHKGSLLLYGSAAAALGGAYVLQKSGVAWLAMASPASLGPIGDLWFGVLIVLLFAGYRVLRYAPESSVGKLIWLALYAGLYLDEWATRVTLAIWPARLPTYRNSSYPPNTLLTKELTL